MAVKVFFPTILMLETPYRQEEVNFEPKIISRDHFLDQQLWHNSLIKIANKTVFLKNWFSKGITRVKHLLGPDNTFLSLNDFAVSMK